MPFRKSIFRSLKTVLTCEHAGNFIPKEYPGLFEGKTEILNSHRGLDLGVFDLFQNLQDFADFSISQNVSRLLVEMNRSLDHPQLFSEFTSALSKHEKNEILEEYYFPYRNSVEKKIAQYIQKGQKAVHFSVHSFTPELNGEKRNADIGLLFDQKREEEKIFCTEFKRHLSEINPELIVKFNYPYFGTDDGFTTYLREIFPNNYCGIELEVNQKFVEENKMAETLKSAIEYAFSSAMK